MIKVCIFGAGAIGGYIGCSLAKAGANVSLIARGPHKEAIEKKLVDQLDITKVHQNFDADVFFPTIDLASWKEISEETFLPDDKNQYTYSFLSYKRIT